MVSGQRFGFLKLCILAFSLAAAAIHFSLMLPRIDPLFTVNAFGFAGLGVASVVALPYLKKYPAQVRLFFIGYTVLTIILWGLIGQRDLLAYFTVGIEMLLIICLLIERP
jgi:hypothetical protein